MRKAVLIVLAVAIAIALGIFIADRKSSMTGRVHSTPPKPQISKYRVATTTSEVHSTPPVKATITNK